MNHTKELLRYLVVDESDGVWGDFSCDGLAYEWIDSLHGEHPDKIFRIVKRQGGRMNHTKEPWEVPHFARKDVQCDCTIIFGGNDDCPLAIGNLNRPTGDWKVDEEIPTLDEAIANAKRIVACVNACAGITDAVIEAGIIKKALIAYLGSYDKGMTWNNMKVWEDV